MKKYEKRTKTNMKMKIRTKKWSTGKIARDVLK
jgi:hypothetical protein